MNYIQKEIGGKLRGLKFNRMADAEYFKRVGNNENSIFKAHCMIWSAMVANCYVKGIEVDFTFEETSDWCEELPDAEQAKFYSDVMEVYKSVHKFEEDLPKENEDADKKKLAEMNTQEPALNSP